jgi:phosphatidylglycerophosphate synthase
MSGSRRRGRELAFAAWMLASVAVAVWHRDVVWCAAAAGFGLGARIVAARGAWTPSGRFGVANTVTLLRLALLLLLGPIFVAVPRVAFVAVVFALFALDGVDGWLARRRGEASPFGAALDMETDALGVMVLGLLLWQHRIVGAWVLVAGLWRYSYAAIIAVVPPLGEAPRSRFGRVVFGVLMTTLALAFLPLPHLPSLLAAIGTALVSLSFARSLLQSRAPAGGLTLVAGPGEELGGGVAPAPQRRAAGGGGGAAAGELGAVAEQTRARGRERLVVKK